MAHQKKECSLKCKGAKNSFIVKFFNDKLAKCPEPTRRGKSRGKNIGFSRKKYAASLMALTNSTQEDIAKQLNIPVGSIRNWYMQDPFMDLVFEHVEEFLKLFIKYTEKKFLKYSVSFDKYVGAAIDKRPPDLNWDEFKDFNSYGKFLCDELLRYTYKIAKHVTENRSDIRTELYYISFVHPLYIDIATSQKIIRKSERIRMAKKSFKNFVNHLTDIPGRIKQMMDKGRPLTKSERRTISEYLNMLEVGTDFVKSYLEKNYFAKDFQDHTEPKQVKGRKHKKK